MDTLSFDGRARLNLPATVLQCAQLKLISKLQMYIGRYERSKSARCEIISKLQMYIGRYERSKSARCEIISKLQMYIGRYERSKSACCETYQQAADVYRKV